MRYTRDDESQALSKLKRFFDHGGKMYAIIRKSNAKSHTVSFVGIDTDLDNQYLTYYMAVMLKRKVRYAWQFDSLRVPRNLDQTVQSVLDQLGCEKVRYAGTL